MCWNGVDRINLPTVGRKLWPVVNTVITLRVNLLASRGTTSFMRSLLHGFSVIHHVKLRDTSRKVT